MIEYLEQTTTQIAVVLCLIAAAVLGILACCVFLFKSRSKRRATQSPILHTISATDIPSCTNDAFDCVDETSAKKIEERRRARRQAMQNSPKADLTLRKIDPEIGKALAVEQLMRDSLVFDTISKPPKGEIEVVAAKRDYL